MHLIDEQHVALFELGENRRQIPGALECRARSDVELGSHFGCHDAGHRGLTQAGRPRQQQVVGCFVALAGCFEHDC
jgi:hypothetical protein